MFCCFYGRYGILKLCTFVFQKCTRKIYALFCCRANCNSWEWNAMKLVKGDTFVFQKCRGLVSMGIIRFHTDSLRRIVGCIFSYATIPSPRGKEMHFWKRNASRINSGWKWLCDTWLSPRRPGFDSRHGNHIYAISIQLLCPRANFMLWVVKLKMLVWFLPGKVRLGNLCDGPAFIEWLLCKMERDNLGKWFFV